MKYITLVLSEAELDRLKFLISLAQERQPFVGEIELDRNIIRKIRGEEVPFEWADTERGD